MLVPPGTLKLDLRAQIARRPKPGVLSPGRSKGADLAAAGSWWTARARAGEVTAGFTRDEIMRPAKEDPRAEGGVFTRVAGLLREFSILSRAAEGGQGGSGPSRTCLHGQRRWRWGVTLRLRRRPTAPHQGASGMLLAERVDVVA